MKYVFKDVLKVPAGGKILEGELIIPAGSQALVIFSHGSGSSRFSPRNNFVASILHQQGLSTFLFDLLTPEEDEIYENRFDISLLSERLIAATEYLASHPETTGFDTGYFGASTGAASALKAAAELPGKIGAIVSRGGRPDMVPEVYPYVKAPTLLIVGEYDTEVLALNRKAYDGLSCEKRLAIVPGATHLFEEPGTLEKAGQLAASWYSMYLLPVNT